MKPVRLRELHLGAYRGVARDEDLSEITTLARRLRGKRIVHVNATAYGGGVAELLQSLVPLERDVGLDAQWWILDAPAAFFTATKRLHNALQGMPVDLTDMQRDLFRTTVERQAAKLPDGDVVIAHDPQTVALRHYSTNGSRRWAWRCHIDLTTAHPSALTFLLPYVREHDAALFTLKSFVPSKIDPGMVRLVPPAIDPLSEKNTHLSEEETRAVLARFGVDPARPLLVQVARFDPWKDPIGVIDAFHIVRTRFADAQLGLVGAIADDDPEGVEYLERARAHAGHDPDVHILTNMDGVGAREVNAFQRAATVGILKSIREGFGLTVSESLWKGVPVVGGNAGGIALQIADGVDGFLVSDVEECAERCGELLERPELRRTLGVAGRETVRREFLTTRLLRDHLRLYADLLARSAQAAAD